jgi:ketosteroid isomerase-like protein
LYNSGALSTQQPSKVDDPIFQARQDYQKAIRTGDIELLLSLAAEDIVWMPPNDTTLFGRAEFKEWIQEYFEYFRFAAYTEPERDVVVSGELAIERTSYMVSIVPAKGPTRIRDDGKMLTIWKRQPDGSWKIWRGIWNSIKPIGSGTNRYLSRLMQKRNSRRNSGSDV